MYQKELFLLKDGMSHRALIRNYDVDDFDSLINIQRECFPLHFRKSFGGMKTNYMSMFTAFKMVRFVWKWMVKS